MVGIWASLRLDFAFFNVLFHVIWAYLWVDWAFLWVVSIQICGWQNGLIRPLPGLLLIVLGKCDDGLEQDRWIKTLFQPVLNEINLGRTCHLPSNPLTAPSLHISFFIVSFSEPCSCISEFYQIGLTWGPSVAVGVGAALIYPSTNIAQWYSS